MDKSCGIITYHDEAVFSLATRWQLCTGFGKPGSQSKQLIPRQKCKLIQAHIIGVCYLCISWPRGCAWAWCRSRRPRRSWARWCGTRSPSSTGPVAVKSQRCARCMTGYLHLSDTGFVHLAGLNVSHLMHQEITKIKALPWASLSFFSR